jgi:hypothetical protein
MFMSRLTIVQLIGLLGMSGALVSGIRAGETFVQNAVLLLFPAYVILILASRFDFDRRFEKYNKVLKEIGVSSLQFYPLVYRAMSVVGIDLNPPILERPMLNFIYLLAIYSVLFGYGMFVLYSDVPAVYLLFAAFSAGLIFASVSSHMCRLKREQINRVMTE